MISIKWPKTDIALKAVIFDMDDTLYPERDFVLSGFQAVAKWGEAHLGVSADLGYQTLSGFFESGTRGNTFNLWLDRFNISDQSLIPKLVHVYRQHQPVITPFAKIPQLLKELTPHVALGLITDGYLEVQKRKLNALGLGPYFQSTVFSDQFGREHWKPSTIPFLATLGNLNIDAADAVYIGDNLQKDFLAPNKLGMYSIQVKYSADIYAHQSAPSNQHEAQITVTTIPQLFDLFGLVSA